ncbi:MAG: sulfotransferase domain-containing protein [Anaerolineales bacterium]|nr:sulfotransferase domain-containing protein [Anaerolineales bacterium]
MAGFFKRLTKTKRPIIVVSGLPRSGTSMMMRMLEAAGIQPLTDHIRTADSDNLKGYYEFERVKKLKEGDVAWLSDAQGKAVKIIAALLIELPSNYEYHVLFMRRKMEEILASQNKMLENRGESSTVEDDKMAELFRKHLEQVEKWMTEQSNLRYIDIDYNKMLENPKPQLEEISKFLGSNLNIEKMMEIVDPSLYHQRKQL